MEGESRSLAIQDQFLKDGKWTEGHFLPKIEMLKHINKTVLMYVHISLLLKAIKFSIY